MLKLIMSFLFFLIKKKKKKKNNAMDTLIFIHWNVNINLKLKFLLK